jgi:hypothetical protein
MSPRSLTCAQKLETAYQLYWSARDLKTRTLRRRHPDWDEARIALEVRRVFLFSPALNR